MMGKSTTFKGEGKGGCESVYGEREVEASLREGTVNESVCPVLVLN